MEYCARTLRKTGSGITFITQGVEEIVESPIGHAIMNNTSTKFILLQTGDSEILRQALKLNSQELNLIFSLEQRKGETGRLLSRILFSLEGSALYDAVHRLHYVFVDAPGFARVALKSIRDDDIRSISIDDCIITLLKVSPGELQNCVDDIKTGFNALKPFRPEGFVEALLYAAVEEMEEKIFRAKFKKFDPEGDTAADMNISALQLEPFLEELGTCSPCKR
jgi:hypothetical protein